MSPEGLSVKNNVPQRSTSSRKIKERDLLFSEWGSLIRGFVNDTTQEWKSPPHKFLCIDMKVPSKKSVSMAINQSTSKEARASRWFYGSDQFLVSF